jgi:hypothetical protein
MAVHHVFACLAVLFLILGCVRSVMEGKVGPAARTWLMLGMIFLAVSLWSWLSSGCASVP